VRENLSQPDSDTRHILTAERAGKRDGRRKSSLTGRTAEIIAKGILLFFRPA